MIAQKITNLCYPRGSVVYAEFDKKSEYYYLNMRPLIVVSNQNQMFDSLTVIGCGSRDRPGIEISLFNHQCGHWIGNHQFTVAQPYAIFSIVASQIVEFHGVIDPWTLEAIDKAMAWHLGLSKEVPPYMREIYQEIMAPTYSMGTEENTQLKDPHQFGSQNETTRKFVKIPSKLKKPDFGKSYPKRNTQVVFRPNTNTRESVEDSIKKRASESNATSQFSNTETKDVASLTIDENNQKEESKLQSDSGTPVASRVGTANLYVPKEEDVIVFDDTILSIASSLTDDDRIKLITRKLEAGKYGEIHNVTIWATQIPQIRKAVEYTYGLTSGKFALRMADRICHQQRNFRFLSQFEKICAIMYGSPSTLGISEAIYNEVAKQVIRENHLDFSDGRAWRGYVNMERMKKIYKTMRR